MDMTFILNLIVTPPTPILCHTMTPVISNSPALLPNHPKCLTRKRPRNDDQRVRAKCRCTWTRIVNIKSGKKEERREGRMEGKGILIHSLFHPSVHHHHHHPQQIPVNSHHHHHHHHHPSLTSAHPSPIQACKCTACPAEGMTWTGDASARRVMKKRYQLL